MKFECWRGRGMVRQCCSRIRDPEHHATGIRCGSETSLAAIRSLIVVPKDSVIVALCLRR